LRRHYVVQLLAKNSESVATSALRRCPLKASLVVPRQWVKRRPHEAPRQFRLLYDYGFYEVEGEGALLPETLHFLSQDPILGRVIRWMSAEALTSLEEEWLATLLRDGDKISTSHSRGIHEGDLVRILEGALRGFSGVVQSKRKRVQYEVLVDHSITVLISGNLLEVVA